ELYAVVIGIDRLDDRFARLIAAAGAAGDLCEQLERALRGTKIGDPEPDISRDDADEGHARKVVPLRDHLSTDQDIDLAIPESRQQRAERAFPANGVAIEARDPRRRKRRPEVGLDALGAKA